MQAVPKPKNRSKIRQQLFFLAKLQTVLAIPQLFLFLSLNQISTEFGMGKYALSQYSTRCRSYHKSKLNSAVPRLPKLKGHHAAGHEQQKKASARQWKSKRGNFQPRSSLLLNRLNRMNRGARYQNMLKNEMNEILESAEKRVAVKRRCVKKIKSQNKFNSMAYCPAALLKFVHRLKNPYLKLLAYKTCQICRQIKPDQLTNIIYCSICDDAFHRTCLPQPMEIDEIRKLSQFLCPECNSNDYYNDDNDVASEDENKPIAHFQNAQFPLEYGLYCETMEWMIFQQKGNLKLFDLPQKFWTRRPTRSINLRCFKPIKNSKSYWIPLIKALSTTNHLYCHEQVYKNSEMMELNKSISHRPEVVQMLSLKDEKIYEEFKVLRDSGKAPPLTLQKCPIKGFMTRALDFIKAKTILCQYAGQVLTYRDSLRIPDNDSIFTLLETGQSNTSIDVVPTSYANISKYFLGINNSNIENYEKINVQSILFSYKGRNRIIFYTLRHVRKGQELYIDYNGGLADNYPTENFK